MLSCCAVSQWLLLKKIVQKITRTNLNFKSQQVKNLEKNTYTTLFKLMWHNCPYLVFTWWYLKLIFVLDTFWTEISTSSQNERRWVDAGPLHGTALSQPIKLQNYTSAFCFQPMKWRRIFKKRCAGNIWIESLSFFYCNHSSSLSFVFVLFRN